MDDGGRERARERETELAARTLSPGFQMRRGALIELSSKDKELCKRSGARESN